MRGFGVCALVLATSALAACGDKPQAAGGRIVGTPAYTGAVSISVAPGWKAGDEASWDQQMRNRAKAQNEYARISGQ